MTLLSELPVGSKIKFGKYQIGTETPEILTWIKGDNNHYKENAVPLISEYVIDYKLEFDAQEDNNPDLSENPGGNNTYKYSNIDQWLNTNKQSNWFIKAHDYDEPPSYVNKPGFLHNFSQYEQSLIEDVPIRTTLSYSEDDDTFQYEDIIRKIFLLSSTEYNFSSSTKPEEGTVFEDLFTAEGSTICEFSPQLNTYLTENNITTGYPLYWTRTPNKYISLVQTFFIDPNEHCYAYDSSIDTIGVRPALNLKSTVEVSDTPDTDGYYTVILPTPKTLQNFKKLALQEEVNLLTNKVNSLELSGGSSSNGNADILTTIMILQDEQPGQVVGLGIYLDCLTDQSTFTITNGFYDSSKKLVYVG